MRICKKKIKGKDTDSREHQIVSGFFAASGRIVRGADTGCSLYYVLAVICSAFADIKFTALMKQEIHDVEALQASIYRFYLNKAGF